MNVAHTTLKLAHFQYFNLICFKTSEFFSHVFLHHWTNPVSVLRWSNMFKLSISVVCELGVTSRYVATVCVPYLIILLLLESQQCTRTNTHMRTHTHPCSAASMWPGAENVVVGQIRGRWSRRSVPRTVWGPIRADKIQPTSAYRNI